MKETIKQVGLKRLKTGNNLLDRSTNPMWVWYVPLYTKRPEGLLTSLFFKKPAGRASPYV